MAVTHLAYDARRGHGCRRRQSTNAAPARRRPACPPSVANRVQGLRAAARRGPGDPLPEPHLVPRFSVPDADRAAQHQLRRQSRVHGFVEDQVPLSRPRHDPDRPLGRCQVAERARGGRRRAQARRAVRHLPGGHAQPRRLPVQGAHGRGTAGAGGRLPDLPGRRRRHRPHPATRRQVPQAVPVVLDHHRSAGETRPLPRSPRAPPRIAVDDRRSDVRDPRDDRPGVPQPLCRREGRGLHRSAGARRARPCQRPRRVAVPRRVLVGAGQ